jgi:cytochrome P450
VLNHSRRQNEYHEWVATVFDNLHAMTIMHAILQFPFLKFLLNKLLPPSLKRQRDKHHQFSRDKVDERLAKQTSRPDIWSLVIAHHTQSQQSEWVKQEEMYDNAGLFMIAGTETTATLLSGLMYLLLTHEEEMERLKREVRTLKEEDLTLLELPKLKYLNACLEEGLRMYPPVPGGLPRKTPPKGAVIAGKFVSGGVSLSR